MKQTPLKPGKPLERKSTPKRSQPKRDWSSAREKVLTEGRCRFYGYDLGCAGRVVAAHVIGREHDMDSRNGLVPHGDADAYFVRPDRVVPLCRVHHDRFDGRDPHRIDILPALTLEEQVQAVKDAGGIENARVRTCPTLYRSER